MTIKLTPTQTACGKICVPKPSVDATRLIINIACENAPSMPVEQSPAGNER